VGVALFALAALVAKAADDSHDEVWQRERFKDMYRDD